MYTPNLINNAETIGVFSPVTGGGAFSMGAELHCQWRVSSLSSKLRCLVAVRTSQQVPWVVMTCARGLKARCCSMLLSRIHGPSELGCLHAADSQRPTTGCLNQLFSFPLCTHS